MRKMKKIFITFLLILVYFISFSTISNAHTFPKTFFLGNKYEIWKGKSTYTPDTSNYAFKADEANKSIDFFTLYGDSKDIIEYKGEIPNYINHDDFTQVRKQNNWKIGTKGRLWGMDPKKDGLCSVNNNDLCNKTSDYNDSNIESKRNSDIHLWALDNYNDSWIRFDKILFWLCELISKIPQLFLDLIMSLRGLNIAAIFTALTGDVNDSNSLVNVINRLFLFDGNGSISPFLVLCLAGFIIGLTITLVKGLKGNNALATARDDIIYFVISILIVGLAMAGGANQLGGAVTNLVGKVEIALATESQGDNDKIFVMNAGNGDQDIVYTEKALLKKAILNARTQVQFGYSINELNANSENFGNYAETAKGYIARKDGSGNIETYDFKVCTGSGVCSNQNLAYYLWAANSGVNEKEPLTSNKKSYQTSTNDRILFVIDYLNIIKQLDSNENIQSKIDTITSSMVNPNYMGGCATMILLTVEMCFLVLVLFKVILNVLLGKVMVIIVFFLLPVIGPLLLFNKTRQYGKDMMKMFVTGFARLTIYSLIFDTTLIVISQVNGMGMQGILIAIVLLFVLKKFLPVIDEKISEMLRRNSPQWANEAALGIRRWGNKKKNNLNERRNKFRDKTFTDRHGNERRVGDTVLGKVATGITADDRAQFRQAVNNKINPVKIATRNIEKDTKNLEQIKEQKISNRVNELKDQMNDEITNKHYNELMKGKEGLGQGITAEATKLAQEKIGDKDIKNFADKERLEENKVRNLYNEENLDKNQALLNTIDQQINNQKDKIDQARKNNDPLLEQYQKEFADLNKKKQDLVQERHYLEENAKKLSAEKDGIMSDAANKKENSFKKQVKLEEERLNKEVEKQKEEIRKEAAERAKAEINILAQAEVDRELSKGKSNLTSDVSKTVVKMFGSNKDKEQLKDLENRMFKVNQNLDKERQKVEAKQDAKLEKDMDKFNKQVEKKFSKMEEYDEKKADKLVNKFGKKYDNIVNNNRQAVNRNGGDAFGEQASFERQQMNKEKELDKTAKKFHLK